MFDPLNGDGIFYLSALQNASRDIPDEVPKASPLQPLPEMFQHIPIGHRSSALLRNQQHTET